MSRLHREACGALGCDFVAGPSRDLTRVQRIADEHRATGHVLDVAAVERVDAVHRRSGPCGCPQCVAKRRDYWQDRGGLATRRRLKQAETRRLADLERLRAAAEVSSSLAIAAWSSRICPVCRESFAVKSPRHLYCSNACRLTARRRGLKPAKATMAGPIRHGTDSGYTQHLQRRVPTCAACRRAHRVASEARSARRRERAA